MLESIAKHCLGTDISQYPRESWGKVSRTVTVEELMEALEKAKRLGSICQHEDCAEDY